MTQTPEAQRLATRLRMLKERAGTSFEELARQTGVSRSSLHRYCSGAKVPTAYGPLHAFAKACGATGDELRELHRLWALADTARADRAALLGESRGEYGDQRTDSGDSPGNKSEDVLAAEGRGQADGIPSRATPPSVPGADSATSLAAIQVAGEEMSQAAPKGAGTGNGRNGGIKRRRGLPHQLRGQRGVVAAVAAAVLVIAGTAAFVVFGTGAGEKAPAIVESQPNTMTVASVRVHNVEGDCKSRTERVPACSLGLARDPRRKYAAGNVVEHRVWHGDVLRTDCILYDGDRVEDETGVGTTRWFRVLLDDVPGGHAWLPAVRTNDHPKLPTCA